MRSVATGAWNAALPKTVARTLPRGLRRAITGVRRPIHRVEHEVLYWFGGEAPARRFGRAKGGR